MADKRVSEELRARRREAKQRWVEAHADEYREYMRRYHAQWYRDNPDKVHNNLMRYYARKLTKDGYRVFAPDGSEISV